MGGPGGLRLWERSDRVESHPWLFLLHMQNRLLIQAKETLQAKEAQVNYFKTKVPSTRFLVGISVSLAIGPSDKSYSLQVLVGLG